MYGPVGQTAISETRCPVSWGALASHWQFAETETAHWQPLWPRLLGYGTLADLVSDNVQHHQNLSADLHFVLLFAIFLHVQTLSKC